MRMRRRSVSSFVSPGPLVPMPPPSRDSAAPAPTSRGSRYLSCASSTCSLPSRVRARRAKMSRISCVRSMTFRPTIFSISRSCAGVSSVSNTTTSTPVSAHDAASTSIFPRAQIGGGIRLRPLLQHAQHDLRAGGFGESGELLERALRLETTGASGNEPDQRRLLDRRYSRCGACFHVFPRYRAGANQSRLHVRHVDDRRRPDRPGVLPESSSRSRPLASVAATSSGIVGGRLPLTFALVAVTGRSNAAHRARATACDGTRTPIVRPPAVTPCASRFGRAHTSVSGPGQNRVGEAVGTGAISPIHCVTWAMSAATSGSARSSGGP